MDLMWDLRIIPLPKGDINPSCLYHWNQSPCWRKQYMICTSRSGNTSPLQELQSSDFCHPPCWDSIISDFQIRVDKSHEHRNHKTHLGHLLQDHNGCWCSAESDAFCWHFLRLTVQFSLAVSLSGLAWRLSCKRRWKPAKASAVLLEEAQTCWTCWNSTAPLAEICPLSSHCWHRLRFRSPAG